MYHVTREAKASMEAQERPSALVLTAWERTSNEISSFVKHFQGSVDYKQRLERLIDRLNELTGTKRTVVLTLADKYDVTTWGNLYWTFFHAASILVAYYIEIGRLEDTAEFDLLMHNIDEILYCGICKYHYKSIKDTAAIKDGTTKNMSFGFTIRATVDMHNLITRNIYDTSDNYTRIQRFGKELRQFNVVDMALTWGVVENTTRITAPSTKNEYLKPHVDWQTDVHIALSIICAVTKTKNGYIHASEFIKENIYRNENSSAEERCKIIDETFFDAVSLRPSVIDQIDEKNREYFLAAVGFLYERYYESVLRNDFETRITDSKHLNIIQNFAKEVHDRKSVDNTATAAFGDKRSRKRKVES